MTQQQADKLSLLQRIKSPTPKFFRILKYIGLSLAAVSGTIVAGPVAVPAIVSTIAGYVALASAVVTAVSQVTVETEE